MYTKSTKYISLINNDYAVSSQQQKAQGICPWNRSCQVQNLLYYPGINLRADNIMSKATKGQLAKCLTDWEFACS